jgi:hypothetical protein
VSFDVAWTLQPSGTKFNPPARVSLPNTSAGLPGQEFDMVTFDHDLGEWVSMGPGVVSEDGSRVVSKTGYGIREAGWGGLCPPPDDTCNIQCDDGDECTNDIQTDCACQGELIVGKERPDQEEGNCKTEFCDGTDVANEMDVDKKSDTMFDCKMPACSGDMKIEENDIDDLKSEDEACNDCTGMKLTPKTDGTITKDDECLFCSSGKAEDVMDSEISGLDVVCPGETVQYSIGVNLPMGSLVWTGADANGRLVVPASAMDNDIFNITAKVNSCSVSKTVTASDGRPGDDSEAFVCGTSPFDCAELGGFGNMVDGALGATFFGGDGIGGEAEAWAQNNLVALGDGNGGGCADAARHAYFNAVGVFEVGEDFTRRFLDAHEFSNFVNGCVDNNMDLINNDAGRAIGRGCNDRACAQRAVADALNNGELTVWSGNRTGSGSLVSSNVCNVTF